MKSLFYDYLKHYFKLYLPILFGLISVNSALAAGPKAGFNPDVGLNASTLFKYSPSGTESNLAERNGLELGELELQFSGDVDPYWRLQTTLSLHSEVAVDSTTTPATRTSEYIFEPEELFAESLDLPGWTLKLGKFKAAFGRHNLFHTHAYPFIDAPITNTALLGAEGLNDVGVSLAAMLPFAWFSEVTLQALSGQGEGLDYFHSISADSLASLVHWRNLWELNDDLTWEMGLSGASGSNSAGRDTVLTGTDLTLKWRPDQEHAVVWTTEYLYRSYKLTTDEEATGLATWLQLQLAKRWWVGLRGEALRVSDQDAAKGELLPSEQNKTSVIFSFVPSEFSSIRVQLDELNVQGGPTESRAILQMNYALGAHPAHSY